EKIVSSIAPSIFGLEEVKLAIALQLFGGVEHIQKDKSRVRGEIHILLVGEPSTAKTSLMSVVVNLIPRARYVSGKGLTGVGLTATVTRDEELFGGWVLEAGALVLCNKSLLAIDEFEKIDKQDMIVLHEAMESGRISIAKANIVATLPAKTSILAGGNPKFSRFDPYLPIREQLDVPETILSRFDLKFALRDVPNPEADEKLVNHILEVRHFGRKTIEAPIPPELFRKYVAYARKKCFPQLTEEAAEEIKKFYIDLRKKSASGGPIAITPRQYEALIRLSEASAKIQLREYVTKEDALRAIKLMSASLRQFGFEPETGEIDIDRAEGAKATAVQRSKIRTVLKIIEDMESLIGKELPTDEVVKKAKSAGIEDIEEIIRKLLQEGVLYSPRPGFISRV
ncbi:MAG: minichromosome maintenance protein MCM, partial [Candidatus Aenigmatarchaeota archaeon]